MFTLKIILTHLNPFYRLVKIDQTFSVSRGYLATESTDCVYKDSRVIRHLGVVYTWRAV